MSYFQIEIIHKKTISREQLIGIVCGSAAGFFLLIYIIIFINRKKNHLNGTYLWTESEEINPNEKDEQKTDKNINDKSLSSENFDLDFWL